MADLYYVNLAKLELCFSEFLSLSGAGLELATKNFAQDLEGRGQAATFVH